MILNMVRSYPARVVKWLIVAAVILMLFQLASRYLFPNVEFKTVEEIGKDMSEMDKESLVTYLSSYLEIKYEVENNLIEKFSYIGKITLANIGKESIGIGPWAIYFFHPVDIEGKQVQEDGHAELANRALMVSHINGGLHKLQPTSQWSSLQPGEKREIHFKGGRFIASKTDVYPNWFVAVKGVKPKVLKSTEGESLSFVGDFDKPAKWKRGTQDRYDPYTPEFRYRKNEIEDLGKPGGLILPTPVKLSIEKEGSVGIDYTTWVIVSQTDLEMEAKFLAGKTGMKVQSKPPEKNYVLLQLGKVDLQGSEGLVVEEAYRLEVASSKSAVILVGTTRTGVFHGLQSLLTLLHSRKAIPDMKILDSPRFAFRGVMLDIARNFFPKTEIIKVIDTMAQYKLNKLHLHLADDEGWRVEIPGLPELTEVASKRGFDLIERTCLIPTLGSGPEATGLGCGYYTIEDYKDILQHAKLHHIEVIPEIDMPGHAHAAIKAMEARYHKLIEIGKTTEAEEYLLSDLSDKSVYQSVQQFKDNAINPCMDSSYRFVQHVIATFIELHKDVMPLKTFHVGGDEVPQDAFTDSPLCKAFYRQHSDMHNNTDLLKKFSEKVVKIASRLGVNVQGWEDMYYKGDVPLKFESSTTMIANAWHNVWEGSTARRAHDLANNDYKVVIGAATHLYFDHAHEPDPEERGLYWATRFIDIQKVFGFMPERFFDNVDVDRYGKPITKEDICLKSPELCPPLKKPSNIIGIEGHVWGELLRKSEFLHMMLYPRMLALAERSWHRAPWELEGEKHKRERMKAEDWTKFANTLGYRELPRLEELGIKYYLPAPGVVIEDGKLKVNSAIPGLPFVCSTDGGHSWNDLISNTRAKGKVLLATRSLDGKRRSRPIEVVIP